MSLGYDDVVEPREGDRTVAVLYDGWRMAMVTLDARVLAAPRDHC